MQILYYVQVPSPSTSFVSSLVFDEQKILSFWWESGNKDRAAGDVLWQECTAKYSIMVKGLSDR
jgi:hypothetical protein